MLELDLLIKPQWGIEKWLKEALEMLNEDEEQEILQRMNGMFCEGIPLKLKHNKVLYAHVFGMLAQLEALAVQVPLKFLSALTTHNALKKRMRQQLVDEIFHTLVFLKVANELSVPFAFPPAYETSIEEFCTFVTSESDVRTVVIMLNLIGEGWIEQIFDVLHKADISPQIFNVILEDEKRHVAEAELYQELGLPDHAYMQSKLSLLEEKLITNVIFKPKNALALAALIGVDGCYDLLCQIDEHHRKQTAKLKLIPGDLWQYFMKNAPFMMSNYQDNIKDKNIPLTFTRKLLMTNWDNPSSPTMSSEFSIDVTRLHFFEKRYPADTITLLSLQALSKTMAENPQWCRYVSNNEIFQVEDSYTSLIVKLPGHDSHLGAIYFKNCHELSTLELSTHIKHELEIMNYCYEKAMQLKEKNHHLMDVFDDYFKQKKESAFALPDVASSVVSLSNVGQWGFERVTSPLLPGEAGKVTLTKIQRVQGYNHKKNTFEIIDKLPINVSVDHRILDANMPLPKEMTRCFNEVFNQFEADLQAPKKQIIKYGTLKEYIKDSKALLKRNLDYGFRVLLMNGHQLANYDLRREPIEQLREG